MKSPTPDEYCRHVCLYRGTLDCDDRLKCCPLWNYLKIKNPSKP